MGTGQSLSVSADDTAVKNQNIPESVSTRLRELLTGEFTDHVLSKSELVAVAKELVHKIHTKPSGRQQ